MKVLVDTHLVLWALAGSPKLPAKAASWLADNTKRKYVSAATIWEVAIKHAKWPLDMPVDGQALLGYVQDAGFDLLPITGPHAAAVDALPNLHSDPFDRILVAQAQAEDMQLLTSDNKLSLYGERVVLC
jgi:PIN domain nuclease of toxin-antitoxin system